MKELESSQEVVLLRDAIIIAAGQGSDFRNEESSETCAKIIKEAVDGVEMMLGVDTEDPEVRDLARNTMHKLLFYKTMMSSNDLDEEGLKYCKHACGPLPDICWQTYVRCTAACNWIDLAEEIWNQDTDLEQNVAIDRILCVLRSVRVIPNFLDFFYAVLRARFNLVCKVTDADKQIIALDYIGQQLNHLTASYEIATDESVPKQCIVSSLHFLSYVCMNLPEVVDRLQNKIQISLHYIVMLIKKMLQSVTPPVDLDVIYASENCAEAIRNILKKFNNLPSLTSFLDFIEKINAVLAPEDGEKRLSMYIESITQRDSMLGAAIEKLLSSLQSNVDLAVVNCLVLNSDTLQPCHISALLLQTRYMDATNAGKIQQIVRKTFLDWDFGVQDSFRGEWHLEHGFQEFAFAETDFLQTLTETINMLSSAKGEEITAAKEISLLCLQSPAVTLTQLFDFGVHSGQTDTVAQIFRFLKTSFCFIDKGSSFSNQCIARCISSDDLSSHELVNFLSLVEVLIKSEVLTPAELVSTCVMPNLVPSPKCHRFLQLLWTIMNCKTGFEQLFIMTSPPIITLQICKLLHYCMTVNLASVDWDVSKVKERLIEVLYFILDWMSSNANPEATTAHEMCWLWSKLNVLDSTVHPYLLNGFSSHNLGKLCVTEVQQMSHPCLLLCCITQKSKDSVILRKCRKRMNIDRITMTTAIAKILPRLLASEVEMLLHELDQLFTAKLANFDHNPLLSITFVLDSLMILSKPGSFFLQESQWNRTAQTCVTSFKAFLVHHQPISSRSLATLASIICHMATESNSAFRATVSIFLMDLLGQVDLHENDTFSCTLSAINQLGDENLTNQVIKSFECKCSVR